MSLEGGRVAPRADGPAVTLTKPDELMARTIKPAHAAIVLDPDAGVELLDAGRSGGAQKLVLVTPVLTPELHRAGSAEAADADHGASQEGDERVLRHFADGHRELAVGEAGAAGDEACDRHIVGRIGEDEPGDRLIPQRGVARHPERVATEDLMGTQTPEIAGTSHCRT